MKSHKLIRLVSILAVLFGLVTLKAGGSVLFVDGEARRAAGDYVAFVLWFNFIAAFFYILAGAGLFFLRQWSIKLALLIAIASVFVFIALLLHIGLGGVYEIRTVVAMLFRCTSWFIIAIIARRKLS